MKMLDKIITKFLDSALKSWKTTLAGVLPGTIIVLTEMNDLVDGVPETVFSTEAVLVGIGLIAQGIFARDNDKASEEANSGR
jgi:hypothetical protein